MSASAPERVQRAERVALSALVDREQREFLDDQARRNGRSRSAEVRFAFDLYERAARTSPASEGSS